MCLCVSSAKDWEAFMTQHAQLLCVCAHACMCVFGCFCVSEFVRVCLCVFSAKDSKALMTQHAQLLGVCDITHSFVQHSHV